MLIRYSIMFAFAEIQDRCERTHSSRQHIYIYNRLPRHPGTTPIRIDLKLFLRISTLLTFYVPGSNQPRDGRTTLPPCSSWEESRRAR